MATRSRKSRIGSLALVGLSAVICVCGQAQIGNESSPATQPAAQIGREVEATASQPLADKPLPDKPLPDIPTLMHQVEENQRKAEAIEKNYIYHSVATVQELDGHGRVKKTTVTESDHFWIDGVPVRRVVKKDGKELTAEEIAKENERIDKEAAKGRERREKADAKGKESDSNGNEEITVSRLLALGAFTNPRREQLNGRSTIAVDYTGDPKAKTLNPSENLIRELAGTAWVDEQDCVLARVEGHFVNAFKIGGGLLVDIKKDTRFTFEQTRVNGEVWLPARIDAQGSARALIFVSFSGKIHAVESDYRKFRTSSTILPGVAKVPDAPQAPEPTPSQP
jgi:hypothetical protein